MTWYLLLLAIVGGMGLAAVAVGRVVAAACGLCLAARPSLEGRVAAAFVGTGFLALAYGWGSYLGLPARGCLAVTGLAGRQRRQEGTREPPGAASGAVHRPHGGP